MSISAMKRLTVFAFRRDSDRMLRRLMGLRCVEVQVSDNSDTVLALKRADTEAEMAQCASALRVLDQALPLLQRYSSKSGKLHGYDPETYRRQGNRERAMEVANTAIALAERMDEESRICARLETEILSLEPWMDCDLILGDTETMTTRTCLGVLPKGVSFTAFSEAVTEFGGCAELIESEKQATYVSVTYFKCWEKEWNALASSFDFMKIELSYAGTVRQAAEQLENEIKRLSDSMAATVDRLCELAEQLDIVEILHDLLSTDRSVAELHCRLAQTDTCSVLEGWIPESMQGAVEEVLTKFECAYDLRDPLEDEEPPILLKNNMLVRNFEWVVGMYSYPKYGRFDPTTVMSIFYFLIFGLMFADVGYGLLLAVGGFGGSLLMKRKPSMQRSFCMFGYCGLASVFMGALFGGWFGDLPTAVMQNLLGLSVDSAAGRFFGSGLLFNPLDDPLRFMVFSLVVGGVHLITGMAIRFFILCKDGKVGEAFATVATYWVLFAGLILLLVDQTLGLSVAALGALLIIVFNGYGIKSPLQRLAKGFGGIYGLLNYVSDLLSYSRILALGLVAAVIAKVINMITLMGSSGALGAGVMVVVLIVGHILNLAINVLGSFVHTSRLQYMEFFGKFYEDGGRPFKPAEPTEEYSETIEL